MKFAMGPPIFASSRTHDIASASPSRAAAAHAVVASFAYLLISNCSLILRRNWAPLLRAAQRSCACPGVASASWCARSTSMKSTSTLASAALTCVRCVSVSESGRVCCAALRIFAAKPTRSSPAAGAGAGAGAGAARHSASSAASVVATPLNGTPSAAASARTSPLIVVVRRMSTAAISASVRALSDMFYAAGMYGI